MSDTPDDVAVAVSTIDGVGAVAPRPVGVGAVAPRPVGAAPRTAWADAAKAVCILLVVLGHVTYLLVEPSRWFAAAGSPPVWNALDVVLRPVRIPLFFTVSGFFAAAALARPWRSSVRGRVAQNLYLHVLWILVAFAAVAATGVESYMAPEHASGLPGAVLTASTGLWYLYALAAYFVVARTTRDLPAVVPVALAAALAVCSFAGLLPTDGDTHSVLENLVWFLVGARCPDLVRRVSARPRPAVLAVLLVVLVVVLGALRLLDPPAAVGAVLELPTRAGAVLAGVLVAVVVVTRFPRLSAPLLRLGRRTLPVYAVHGVLLVLLLRPLAAVTEPVFGGRGHAVQLLLVLVYPLVLTAVLACTSLLVQALARRVAAGWLFALPSRRPGGSPASPQRAAPRGGPSPG